MKYTLILILASLVILAVACPAISTLTPRVSAIPVASVPATSQPATNLPATSLPQPSPALPTQTQPARIRANGPYLVYLRQSGTGPELILLDADGKGQAVFPYPMADTFSLPENLSNLVSPDGAWLASYTGSAGPAFGQSGPQASDLSLNLLSLSTTSPIGTIRLVTQLLSADYPANFALAAESLGRTDITAQILRDAFVDGITRSIAWSPDGSQLAFAGQMDGLSSDLYLFNVADGSINRLSSGPEQVEWISWSPDGKWILDGSTYVVGEGMSYDIYATSPDGQVVRQLLANFQLGDLVWLNPQTLLTWQTANGPGNFGVERLDLPSGRVDKIWDDSFSALTPDTVGNWLAVRDWTDGLALINLQTLKATRLKVPDSNNFRLILSLSSDPQRLFLTLDERDQSVYYLSSSATLTPTATTADLLSVAPDQLAWIAVKDDIRLFHTGNSQPDIFTFPTSTHAGDFAKIVWRPDDSGIFLVSSSNALYSLDFSTGLSSLVEPSLATFGPAGLFWVAK